MLYFRSYRRIMLIPEYDREYHGKDQRVPPKGEPYGRPVFDTGSIGKVIYHAAGKYSA